MEKNFTTKLTAQDATETNETKIDSYTTPLGVTKLSEVGVQITSPGYTTLEAISGVLTIKSGNAQNWTDQAFVTSTVVGVTSGAVVLPATIHDVNIPVAPSTVLDFYFTANVATAINFSCRAFGKFN
jgi:hypothetical protein